MPQGTVKWFNATKGYGFITSDEGGDIFVHRSDLAEVGYRREVFENQRVEFEIAEGRKGPKAVNVKIIE
jgi:cold shock protein